MNFNEIRRIAKSYFSPNKPINVPDVPSTPGKPLVMSFSSRTVKLSWAPPLDVHNSPVREYIIKVGSALLTLGGRGGSCCKFLKLMDCSLDESCRAENGVRLVREGKASKLTE